MCGFETEGKEKHMSEIGKKLRLSRLIDKKTGRTVIIAFDHGFEHGPADFPEKVLDPRVVVRAAAEGGANGIMMHKGVARYTADEWAGKIPLILKITGRTQLTPEELAIQAHVASVEDAVSLGADGVAITIYVGSNNEPKMLKDFGQVETRCRQLGMPILALMYPRGPGVKDRYNVEYVKYAARLGAELGVDIVKTYYTGNPDTFREVIKSCHVPVVAAGGPRKETAEEALEMVKEVMEAGAIGVTIGRNVWGHPDPVGMTRAIRKILMHNASVKEALKEVRIPVRRK
jgi:fructose-bisphosphate aldolase/2-amino-3,7-dideoxy-D-threo-hept-6-ulosonate synthase